MQKSSELVGSQYHLAVAGGCEANTSAKHGHVYIPKGFAPTRYREVVLTTTNCGFFGKSL